MKSWVRTHPLNHPEVVLGCLAALAILIRCRPEFQLDEARFVEYAENLSRGFYAPRETLFLWNGPGYPLLLWPFQVLGLPWVIAKLGNALLFYGALRHMHRAMQAVSPPIPARNWTWALGAYALIFGFSWLPLLMTETLAFFCAAGALRHLVAWPLALKGRSALILAGFYFAALALTRFFFGYMLLAVVVFAALAEIAASLKRLPQVAAGSRAWRGWGLACALALGLCGPYLVYTWHLTGKVFYWGNTGGSQLYTLTLPEKNLLGDVLPMDMLASHPEVSPTAAALLKSMPEKNEVLRDLAFRRAAWENIRAYPGKVFQNWRANANRLVFDYPFSRFPGSHSRLSTGNWSLVFGLWFYALGLTLVLAAARWRAIPAHVSIPLGFFMASLFALSCVSAYARFVFPLLPFLGFAMAGIWRMRPNP